MDVNKSNDTEVLAKELLKNKFNAVTDISEEAMNELLSLLTFETYPKNTIIFSENQSINDMHFIFKGIIRIYYHKNDKLIIERFEKEGGFFGGSYDHLSKYPKVHNIESLEDLMVLKIKQEDIEMLFKKYHELEHLYRLLLEAFHYTYVDKLYILKAASSEERYRDFEKEYGDVMNRISLRNVASYLNMTPETVSRIRASQEKK